MRQVEPNAGSFGSILRSLRLAAGLSQETLAERARLSVESIGALERGVRRGPYRSTVDLLAAGLGLGDAQRAALDRAAERGRGPRAGTSSAAPPVPAFITSFIDREIERAALARLLAAARMITLCGPGGVGKTRLALAAAQAAALPASAVHFVDLAVLRDPRDVLGQIAVAIGFTGFVAQRGIDSIVDRLRAGDALLVFDNCEHLIDPCAYAIEAILRGCARVRIIATSREPLLVDGEALYRVAPFSDAQPAIDLFIERARTAASAAPFVAERSVLERITRRLDGIPLAIELAAGLARTQTASAIADAIDGAAFLAGATRRTSNAHQRTMEATLAWSCGLISEEERAVLRSLAYPVAGTAQEALAAIAGARSEALIRRLIDVSLVVAEPATGRIKLHAMTRQYVASITSEAEAIAIGGRQARWLADRMRAAFDEAWRTASYRIFEPLAAELDNLRQALETAIERRDGDLVRDLTCAPDYWTAVGRTPEGFRWLAQIDADFGIDGSDERDARLLFGIALCAAQSGLPEAAREPGRRAAEAARHHGITLIEARCAVALGNSLLVLGDPHAAAASLAHAIALFESTGDTTGRARAHSFHALALIELEDAGGAAEHVAAAARLYAGLPEPVGATEELVLEMLLGDIARLRGDVATAVDRAREAATLLGPGHRTWVHLRAMHHYVDALIAAGDLTGAFARALPELERLHERGFATDVALLVERLAIGLLRRGAVQVAAQAAGFAEHRLQSAGRRRLHFDRLVRATLLAELQDRLAPAELEALARAGERTAASSFIATIAAEAQVAPVARQT